MIIYGREAAKIANSGPGFGALRSAWTLAKPLLPCMHLFLGSFSPLENIQTFGKYKLLEKEQDSRRELERLRRRCEQRAALFYGNFAALAAHTRQTSESAFSEDKTAILEQFLKYKKN